VNNFSWQKNKYTTKMQYNILEIVAQLFNSIIKRHIDANKNMLFRISTEEIKNLTSLL